MNEKINILNIELYQTSAKAAMQKVVQYMESDSINTVEIITMDMLLKGKDMPGWKEAVESLNLVLPGETEILEAAGVREKTLLRDTAGLVFLKMFLRYIQRNKKRVFLVAQSETELLEMESAIREHDRKLILAGRGVLPPDGAGIEQVINAVNGAETDCIFFPASITGAGAFDTEEQRIVKCKSVVWVRERSERNLYEKAEKRKASEISAQESVPLPGGTAAEK